MNVLITGAGGAATPTLIQMLKENGRYNPILADMNLTPIIKNYDAISVQIPPAVSKEFISEISKVVNEYDIKAIVPGVDEELIPLARHYSNSGDPILLTPDENIIKLCLDKYKLNKYLNDNNIEVPKTWRLCDFDKIDHATLNKSLIAKPVHGRGSRGIYFSDSAEEAKHLAKYLTYKQPNSIFQEYIRGVEYTISMVCSKSRDILGIIPKKVIVKKGITISAVTEKNSTIESYCIKIQKALRSNGPMNIQLILSDEGIPYVFEINPRISTTTILTMKAGFDEIDISIRDRLNEKLPSLDWKNGVMIQRNTNNHFFNCR